jgi:hypothetical protein
MIRVGRIKSANETLKYDGFIPIVVMMSSSPYYSLSPYSLKIKGKILENIWQFSKVYEEVPASTQTYSKWDSTVIWEHPAETHVIYSKGGIEMTEEYYAWRKKGMFNEYAVRYPVGFKHRTKCIGSLKNKDDDQMLGYIDARKQIYLPNYIQAVQKEPQFLELKKLLSKGKNLLIIEVDGPHQESLEYYMKKYGVDEDFIEDNTVLATSKNLNILLNDEKHAFGHGYCLAMALLEK